MCGALALLPVSGLHAAAPNPSWVGGQVCADCHAAQAKAWRGSDHDRAMMEATQASVLGDFDSARFEHFGIETVFYREQDHFMLRTDGPDGKLQDYPIKYTFGVRPLQQYLIEFPGRRLQALDIAWDARPAEQGGQRWFALHPDSNSTPDDVLHWTGPNLNWNYMCAECHSTNLHKNYSAETQSYQSTWSELNVGCEACHGPGEKHVEWARGPDHANESVTGSKGLTVQFDERKGVSWIIDGNTGAPKRSVPKSSTIEIEVCAQCHSRRSQISDDWIPGQPFLDAYLPSLLTENLYHPDGQIDEEVYVWGSFLQSRMYQAGVSCSDCHDPHSGQLKLPGDQVCTQCHAQGRYAGPSHHFHQPASTGASCIGCHMPDKVYMGVDARRDHSIRVPQPDLTVSMGTPNACNQCHTAQSAIWAVERVRAWYGRNPSGMQKYAPALHAAREQRPEAPRLLREMLADGSQPNIARATAYLNLGFFPDRQSVDLLRQALSQGSSLERLGALSALNSMPADTRMMALPLLADKLKAVRIEAARLLASVPQENLQPEQMARLQKGIAEYIEAQRFNAERPESQVNLGMLFADLGRVDEAEKSYRLALSLQPGFEPAYANLAHLLDNTKGNREAIDLLTAGLEIIPQSAVLKHAMGLALARRRQLEPALAYLADAARSAPDVPRFSYVYAIALNSNSKPDQALQELASAHERHPADIDILFALVTINRDVGNLATARKYALELKALMPEQPAVDQLLKEVSDPLPR